MTEVEKIHNYIVVTEQRLKNRLECWIARAFAADEPTLCLGEAEGWSEVGAANNLTRTMQSKFRQSLKEAAKEPERIINYRNL